MVKSPNAEELCGTLKRHREQAIASFRDKAFAKQLLHIPWDARNAEVLCFNKNPNMYQESFYISAAMEYWASIVTDDIMCNGDCILTRMCTNGCTDQNDQHEQTHSEIINIPLTLRTLHDAIPNVTRLDQEMRLALESVAQTVENNIMKLRDGSSHH